jgi:hypothetical protein
MWFVNHFYKVIICVVVFFTNAQNSSDQSYVHSPNDTFIANAFFDDVGVFNISQIQTANDTLFFKWKKFNINMPNNWDASICDVGHCYTSVVDSSTMDAVYPGDMGLMSLHLNPHFQAGTGIVKVLFWEAKTPLQTDTLTWIISVSGSIGIKDIEKNNAVTIYPNPTNNQLTIHTNYKNGFDYLLTDFLGKIILQNHSHEKILCLQTTNFANGNYLLTLINCKDIRHLSLIIQH